MNKKLGPFLLSLRDGYESFLRDTVETIYSLSRRRGDFLWERRPRDFDRIDGYHMQVYVRTDFPPFLEYVFDRVDEIREKSFGP